MIWYFDFVAREVVVPVHSEQVARVCSILVNTCCAACWNAMWLGKFGKSRQHNVLLGKALNAVFQRSGVHNPVRKTELFLQGSCVEG